MADTRRTTADLLANLFQDGQAASSITAQDMRDLIISLTPSHGAFVSNVPAATTIAVAGTYVKAAGTTTFDASPDDFDDDSSTDNRVKYTGTPTRHAIIDLSASFTCASSNQVIGFKIAKNGTVIDGSVERQKIATGADIASVAISAHVDLDTGDYIELWVTNETTTGAVTVEEMHCMVTGLVH